MNILETTTYPNYQNYQKSSVTSFKANETGGQTGGGSSILLGTVAAASAAVAGVALYKNHKTSKALKDTFTKLKETEINLNAAKDKIAETQKKLDEISVVKEEEKTGKFSKKLKKTGKKAVKKTRKFFKKTGKKIGIITNNIKSKFVKTDNRYNNSQVEKSNKKLEKKLKKAQQEIERLKANKPSEENIQEKKKKVGLFDRIKNVFTKKSDKKNAKNNNPDSTKKAEVNTNNQEVKEKNINSRVIDIRADKARYEENSKKSGTKLVETEKAADVKKNEELPKPQNDVKEKSDKQDAKKAKKEAKAKRGGLFTRMKNAIQVKWYEHKLDRALKREKKRINKEIKAMDKQYKSAVKASDKRNREWLKEQDKINRREYERVWIEGTKKKPGLWQRFKNWVNSIGNDVDDV